MERLKNNETRTTDFVLDTIKRAGVDHVFGITGGVITNQFDAFTRSPVKIIATQHEQAAAMAVEAYSRFKGFGVGMATSGPGATNLITGMYGCWFDSVPSLFITGQVSTTDARCNNVRQRGFQEADMVATMSPFTKFSKRVDNANDLPDVLGQAIRTAKEGRGGPTHIDLPIDIQQADIPNTFVDIEPRTQVEEIDVSGIMDMIKGAKRPVLILGNGVRMSGAEKEVKLLADMLGWPVLPSWGYVDFIHPNRLETFGVYGNRGSNFAVANSDLILAIGTRLDTRMAGSNPSTFAREAKRIVVDIDQDELTKGVVEPTVGIKADAKAFVQALLRQEVDTDAGAWLDKCKQWCAEYPLVTPEHFTDLNPYSASRIISDNAKDDVVVMDSGGNLSWMMQSWRPKEGQRLFSSLGNSPMGYSLPGAIGAYFATGKEPICVIGDGGIQMNIQELQTLVNYNIPVKIFVYSNDGYGIIRQFQDLYLGGRHVATHEGTPSFDKIAQAYGIRGVVASTLEEMDKYTKEALSYHGPMLVDVRMNPNSLIAPRAIFGKPIEEQHPFLPDSETEAHMFIPRWKK